MRPAAVALSLLCAVAVRGFAQQTTGVEFGVDAALFHYSFDVKLGAGGTKSASTNLFEFPVSAVRVAFPLSTGFALEPSANLQYSSTNGQTLLTLTGDLGLLIDLTHDPKEWRWYVRPAIGVQHLSSSGFNTTDRPILSAGLGARVPLTDRISARYEARYQWIGKSSSASSQNGIGLLAGISVFTR
jgi:hypothetical protein